MERLIEQIKKSHSGGPPEPVLLQAYAMTETHHQVSTSPLHGGKNKPGSVGLPCSGINIQIYHDGNVTTDPFQTGELVLEGDTLVKDYLPGQPGAWLVIGQERYFRTGDLGYFDQDGYLFLQGRLKEMINRGGEKILPLELDNCLSSVCDSLGAVLCVPVPDPVYGEVVGLVLEPRDFHGEECVHVSVTLVWD